MSLKIVTILALIGLGAVHLSPNPPIHKGCDLPKEVREDTNVGDQTNCLKDGYCWKPEPGSPNCYRPHNDTSVKVYVHMMPWLRPRRLTRIRESGVSTGL